MIAEDETKVPLPETICLRCETPVSIPERSAAFAETMPSPSSEEIESPLFCAIWSVIKSWDVNVPEYYAGYCGANGSHVKLLIDAIQSEGSIMKAKPITLWADYDSAAPRGIKWAFYTTKAEQRSNRPDLKPIKLKATATKI